MNNKVSFCAAVLLVLSVYMLVMRKVCMSIFEIILGVVITGLFFYFYTRENYIELSKLQQIAIPVFTNKMPETEGEGDDKDDENEGEDKDEGDVENFGTIRRQQK